MVFTNIILYGILLLYMIRPEYVEKTKPYDLRVMADVALWMVNDFIPTDVDKEVAELKKIELYDDIAFDVLYARLTEEGVIGMDREYLEALLLIFKEDINKVTKSVDAMVVIDKVRHMLMQDTSEISIDRYPIVAPGSILGGELGSDAKIEFLDGAFYAIDLIMDAVLLERKVDGQPSTPDNV
jgi:hypothetical protein